METRQKNRREEEVNEVGERARKQQSQERNTGESGLNFLGSG